MFEIDLPPMGKMKEIGTNFHCRGLELNLLALTSPGIFYLSNKMVVGSSVLPADAANKSSGYSTTGMRLANGHFIETATLTWPTPRLLFKHFLVPKQYRFLFRAHDQQGQIAASRCQAWEEMANWRCFDLNLPTNSSKVQLEIIVAEPRVAEFYVASRTNSVMQP
jgi:hypothetical protein